MLEEVLSEFQKALDKAVDSLKKDLTKIRTGRASPSILEGLKVQAYGSLQPLQHLAGVSAPQPRMLVVKPYDRSLIVPIEKAIQSSGLGFNPQNDGEFLRIPIPALTEERRKELVKLIKKHGEEVKVSVRHARRDAIEMIDQLVKDGEISEDDGKREKKVIQQKLDDINKKFDDMVAGKEKEIWES